MTDKQKPFWEESYRRPDKLDTFGGGKPGKAVADIAATLPPGARVLDLGCGEGRNAIYLAVLGFKVTAFDISVAGVGKLLVAAKAKHLAIDAFVCDMKEYKFPHPFDLIISSGCLHLIKREDWKIVIRNMKEFTVSGGWNITGVFTDTVPEPEDQRGMMVGLFKEGELLEQYKDWEITDSRAFQFTHTHPDGPTHTHAANEIVARKP